MKEGKFTPISTVSASLIVEMHYVVFVSNKYPSPRGKLAQWVMAKRITGEVLARGEVSTSKLFAGDQYELARKAVAAWRRSR